VGVQVRRAPYIVPDPEVCRPLDAVLDGAAAVEGELVELAIGQHRIEDHDLPLLGLDCNSLCAVLEVAWLRQAACAREARLSARHNVVQIEKHCHHAVARATVDPDVIIVCVCVCVCVS
jgi:hypothetical protein